MSITHFILVYVECVVHGHCVGAHVANTFIVHVFLVRRTRRH